MTLPEIEHKFKTSNHLRNKKKLLDDSHKLPEHPLNSSVILLVKTEDDQKQQWVTNKY